MLKLKELRFQNVGRFVEMQTIHFSHLGNLVQVDGQNLKTKGSSGSGKTTIFNALDYLFGINDLPTTVLQSRITEKGISVSANFDWDDKNIWVSRSKARGLVIELPGDVIISGSNKLAEEKLDEIMAIPRKLFRKMLHKRQKEGGFFLNFTPKETYDFLTDCLNLAKLRTDQEKIEAKLKEMLEKQNTCHNQLNSAESALEATKEAIISFGVPPEKDFDISVVPTLKERSENATAEFQAMKASHDSEIKLLDSQRPNLQKSLYDRTRINNLEYELTLLRTEERRIQSLEEGRQAIVRKNLSDSRQKQSALEYKIVDGKKAENEAPMIALEIKKIRENLCPTCDQGWNNEASQLKESKLLIKLRALKEAIESGRKCQQDLVTLRLDMTALEQEVKPKVLPELEEIPVKASNVVSLLGDERRKEEDFGNAQHHLNRVTMDEFSKKASAIRARHSTELEHVANQAVGHKRALDIIVQKIRSYEEAKRRFDLSYDSLKKKEAEHSVKVEELNKQSNAISNEISMAEEAKKAIRAYASRSFDEALETISDTATRLIRSIPNMANATIQLESTKETKDGKVKEEVNAVISIDGELGIPIKSLSGGERSSIDLSVDLAVIDLIELKTGKGINIFVLDEPFTGLDTVSIEMALEVMKNSNLNKILLIVDHNDTVKEMVENRIVVVREGATSVISH